MDKQLNPTQEARSLTDHPRENQHNAQEAREQAILGRIREKTIAAFRQKQAAKANQPSEHSDPPKRWRIPVWRSWSLATAGIALCVMLPFWWGRQETTPPLQTTGALRVEGSPKDPIHRDFSVHAPKGTSGRLAVPAQWEIDIFGGTALSATRRARQLDIRLQHGRLHVHVHPHSMKHFRIRLSKGHQLWVRGTQFMVEQSSTSLYVEVQRGKVEISGRSNAPLLLQKGQGIHIDLTTQKSTRYPSPSLTDTLASKMTAIYQQSPSLLFRYAKDLLQSPSRTLAERRQYADIATALFSRSRKYQEESLLWLIAAHQKLYTPDTFPLYAGCQSCLRGQPFSTTCQTICAQCLREHKDPHTTKHILYSLSRAWSKREDAKSQQQRQRYCLLYQRLGNGGGTFDAWMDEHCKKPKIREE